MSEIPRYLNNGYNMVPHDPGNGKYDAMETRSSFLSSMATLSGMLGPIGGLIGAGLNLAGMNIRNRQQADMYTQYESPQARMAQMVAAGINPNTAAAGIAGSAAPNMSAAQNPDFTGVGAQFGNSANNALQAEALRAQINKTQADASLAESQNVGQNIANMWANKERAALLRKMIAEGSISEAHAQIIGVDAQFAEVNAYENYMQNMMTTQNMVQDLQIKQQEYVNKMAEYQLMLAQIGKTNAEISKIFSDIGVNSALIGKINAETRNIDQSTLLSAAQLTEQQIQNEIGKITLLMKQDSLNIMQQYGYRDDMSFQSNYLRLAASGKREQADSLAEDGYKFVTGTTVQGKYANQQNVQRWIGTISGAVATVGGVIMMATGAGVVPGAALTAYGVNKMSTSFNKNLTTQPQSDYIDFSHLPQ